MQFSNLFARSPNGDSSAMTNTFAPDVFILYSENAFPSMPFDMGEVVLRSLYAFISEYAITENFVRK